jgi:hypothetical protein
MSPEKPTSDMKMVFRFDSKLRYMSEIRHEIKKKRLFFDECKERFGMDEMSQLMKVKNTSEVKGYPFKVSKGNHSATKGLRMACKIVPIETKYDKHEHPCNLENMVLKELTDNFVNKNISPHIAYYFATQKVSNKCRALKHLNLKRLEVEGKIRTHSNMLISEFVEGGSLDNWIFNIYENDKEIEDGQWRGIVFQLVYTIACIQHHYRMMHNDFHYGNILVDDTIQPGGYFVYQINNKTYYIKNTGVIPKLWDFEFSMVYSDKIRDCYPNKFITGPFNYDKQKHKTIIDPKELENVKVEEYNVPYNYNKVYDLHYFLTSLLDLYISQELFDWIMTLYPEELIPEEESSETSSSNSSESSSSSSDSDDTTSTSTSTSGSTSTSSTSIDTSDSEESDCTSDDSDVSSLVSSNSYSDTTDSSSTSIKHISEGRLINGTEELFDLPSPLTLLNDSFFEMFTKKPDDFDEKEAFFFKAGF